MDPIASYSGTSGVLSHIRPLHGCTTTHAIEIIIVCTVVIFQMEVYNLVNYLSQKHKVDYLIASKVPV